MQRLVLLLVCLAAPISSANAQTRQSDGLLVLYNFASSSGNQIVDRSGVGKPLNLTIVDPKSVRRSAGKIELTGSGTLIQSRQRAEKLSIPIKASGELTFEAWLQPANLQQKGPARILSLSKDSVNRNLTLGQDGDHYDVRLRSSKTSANGLPSTAASKKSVQTKITHVVFTRTKSGKTTVYINGAPNTTGNAKGDLGNWDLSYQLILGDEITGQRRWLGTYHLVAVYDRALANKEVKQNFLAGPTGNNAKAIAAAKQRQREKLFVTKIAPLLADHCLECHDSTTRKGGLDLSRRELAFAGGESGRGIVAGKSLDSLVWQSVDDDSMPHDRNPLSSDQKELLKNWIDDGAAWTLEMIDPAVYVHGNQSQSLWVQRLTGPEYIATVQATVGVDIASRAMELLPPDTRADGFNNTAYSLNVDLKHVDAYSQLARSIVQQMDVLKFAARFKKGSRLTDNHMRDLISKMGKWVLRGPLTEDEVVLYRGISTTVASSGGNYKEAVSYIIEAMLQSPRFLYRVESHIGDGSSNPASPYELASRFSYIVWGAPPSKELIAAAESGKLSDPKFARQLIQKMFKDPRAVQQSKEFIRQWINLPRLQNLRPNRKHFPNWNQALADDMNAETLAFFDEVVWKQNRPLAELLNAKVTFLTPRLAKHYGIEPRGDRLQRYDLSETPSRGGLLTHGSVLTIGGDEASMVTRGLLVMHELLRGVVKDPPPCVDTTPVPTKPGLSQRNIAESRIKNEACGGCHKKFEPLAFGLEKFDGLGSFHNIDHFQNRLREDGVVLVPGESKPRSYKTVAELMNLLAANPRVQESLTWKVTQFSLGRPLVAVDAPIVGKIHQTAIKNGGTYQATILEILMSDLVQKTRTESQ